jgi:hypothetical protein
MILEIESGNSHNLTVNSKPIVTTKKFISIVGTKSNLPVTITADFTDIPQEQIEIYFNAFQSAYRDTNVYCNTDNEPKNIEEKKSSWRLNKIVETIFGK